MLICFIINYELHQRVNNINFYGYDYLKINFSIKTIKGVDFSLQIQPSKT